MFLAFLEIEMDKPMFKINNKRLKTSHESIKALRLDRRGEYLCFEYKTYLKECGIVSQLTPLGTPQCYGIAKKRNQTMLDMIRSMMSNATLPKSFWGHALVTIALTINMVSSKSVEKTPYELWFGKSQICLILKMGLRSICHTPEV